MDVNEAFEKLATEGSANMVAARLLEMGCKGNTHEPFACPLSEYAYRMTEERVGVVPAGWGVHNDKGFMEDFTPLPEPLGSFVNAFDGGWYPYLIKEDDG